MIRLTYGIQSDVDTSYLRYRNLLNPQAGELKLT